jgi:lipopolysaccharide/colanic/teichoic acid biosynthesis glycosyltransferase
VLGLVILSPVLIVAAILVKTTSPGPALFRQVRLGYLGRPFCVWKFRTMTDVPREAATEIFAGNAEVTAIGRVLRRFKIDEFPQLLNIVAGDMSFIGPRPGLPSQLVDYTPVAMRRLEVRPGLTGLAQVSGNIYLSWPQRWELDARYVDSVSWSLDAWILLKTMLVVVLGEQQFVTWRSHDRAR